MGDYFQAPRTKAWGNRVEAKGSPLPPWRLKDMAQN